MYLLLPHHSFLLPMIESPISNFPSSNSYVIGLHLCRVGVRPSMTNLCQLGFLTIILSRSHSICLVDSDHLGLDQQFKSNGSRTNQHNHILIKSQQLSIHRHSYHQLWTFLSVFEGKSKAEPNLLRWRERKEGTGTHSRKGRGRTKPIIALTLVLVFSKLQVLQYYTC